MQAISDGRMRETDEHMRATDKRIAERSACTGERVDKLVSGIGEFIRRQ